MKISVVGLSQAGKTTLFNALTGQDAATGGFSGQDTVNVGSCLVPDQRVERLDQIFRPKKKTLARVEVVDVAGIASAEGPGGGIPSDLLGKIRNNDMLLAVVRDFKSDTVAHPLSSVDPARDLEALWTEFLVSDLSIAEGRIERLEATRGKPRFTEENEKELEVLLRARECLGEERPLKELELAEEEEKRIRGFQFLTRKPLLVVVNIDEREIGNEDRILAPLRSFGELPRTEVLTIAARAEAELRQLDAEEAAVFREELGLTEPAVDRIAEACYRLLGYISFFTVGDDEVRAWSIPEGTSARAAAGEIHQDIERGFIRAEVVAYDRFLAAGSLAACKKDGSLRLEGKDYVVRDGEIVHYRFSV